MKKNGLFKILLCTILFVLIGTFIFKVGTGETAAKNYLSIGDSIILSLASFSFQYLLVFLLLVGGLYGILTHIPAYKKLLDTIVSKTKKSSFKFLIGTIIAFAVIAAVTGINLPLLIFVPMIVSIILMLGYDKLVAISSTIGAILIGATGAIFTPYAQSGYATTDLAATLELKNKFVNIWPKLFILIAGIGLLVYFINNHIKALKDKKVKYELTDEDVFEIKSTTKKVAIWPLITIFSVLFVILVLGLVPWNALFEIDVFEKYHTWLTGLKIKDFEIFTSLITNFIPSFGTWLSVGYGYLYIINTLIVLTIVACALTFRVKFDDLVEHFLEGVKKILPAALLSIFAYAVLMCLTNSGNFFSTIITNVFDANKFNLAYTTILTMIGSVLHVSFVDTLSGVYQPIMTSVSTLSNAADVKPVLEIMFQSIHYLTMLIAPTSILLIAGLTYLEIPYKTWLKYIWKLFVALFVIIFIILIIILVA